MQFIGNEKDKRLFSEMLQQFNPQEKVTDETDENNWIKSERINEDLIKIETSKGDTYTFKNYENPGLLNDEFTKRVYYDFLKSFYSKSLNWGALTGVKPVKLYKKIKDKGLDADNLLENYYKLNPKKVNLLREINELQEPYLNKYKAPQHISIYLGIPICPSKCSYCSFVSTVLDKKGELLDEYLKNLEKEIIKTGEFFKDKDVIIDSLYIGGGTPAVLNPEQAQKLIDLLYNNFDFSGLKEFTFEAGRPDAISYELLKTLKENHVNRICINPQTMNDSTLLKINRKHNVDDVLEIFDETKELGFDSINMDLICGLEDENEEDFLNSLNTILDLEPDNLTIHDLSIKRGSKIHEERGLKVSERFKESFFNNIEKTVKDHDYFPYYMYRQKYTIGNGENIGYTKAGKESLYNILMMAEEQTIIGLGAGSSGKLYEPDKDRFSHVFTVKDIRTYNNRIDEIIEKKLENYSDYFNNINRKAESYEDSL